MRRLLRWSFVLLCLAVVLVAATPQGRTGVKTVLFLPQVVPSIAFKPQELFTRDPTRIEVRIPVPEGEQVADLYLPAGEGKHGAVLLFLGVNPAGRDDPRVVGLAEGLARAGMVVMVPWSEHMTQKRIRWEDADNLVFAFQFLQQHPRVDGNRVGMGGFCVGASFSTVAAADPRIRDQVRFVNFFGGYYDATDLLKAIASHTSFYAGAEDAWQANELTREVFATQLIESLPDPVERELLYQTYVAENPGLFSSLIGLSPQGEVVRRLLMGVTLEEAETLILQLSPEVQQLLRQISPSTYIDQLRAPVLIMHDREDSLVPVEESRRLRDALRERGDVHYTEFTFFQHMDPTRPVSLLTFIRDFSKLFLHMYNVLRLGS